MFSVIKYPGKYKTGDTVRVITEEEYIALGCPTSGLGYHISLYDKSKLEPVFGKEVKINSLRFGDSLVDGGYVFYSLNLDGVVDREEVLIDCIYLDDLIIDEIVKETNLVYNRKLGDIVKVSGLDETDFSDFDESIGQIMAIIYNKEFVVDCKDTEGILYVISVETPRTINIPRAILSNQPLVVCKEENITKWEQKMTYNNEGK